MSLDDAAIVAAWSILLVLLIAVAPRVRVAMRMSRPAPQRLRLDPEEFSLGDLAGLDFDLGGPVIDLEPA